MATQQAIPSMPELGHTEQYYARGAKEADRVGQSLLRDSYKVGQYLTLALDVRLCWEEKLRFFRHTMGRHCIPPTIPDDGVWSFYKDLEKTVRDVAGQEALRVASEEDDLYAALQSMGKTRQEIEDRAEVFFARLVPCENCPDWFHPEDYAQLKLIRDQWI